MATARERRRLERHCPMRDYIHARTHFQFWRVSRDRLTVLYCSMVIVRVSFPCPLSPYPTFAFFPLHPCATNCAPDVCCVVDRGLSAVFLVDANAHAQARRSGPSPCPYPCPCPTSKPHAFAYAYANAYLPSTRSPFFCDLAACASSCFRFLRIIFMCTSPCWSARSSCLTP